VEEYDQLRDNEFHVLLVAGQAFSRVHAFDANIQWGFDAKSDTATTNVDNADRDLAITDHNTLIQFSRQH